MRARLAVEELEINKLHDAEVAANKVGLFDETYHALKTSDEANKKEEEESEEDTPEDTTSTDEPADEPSEEMTDESLNEATEAYRNYRISEEDIKDRLVDAGRSLWNGAKYLGELGVKYGPDLLSKVYKGFVFTACKIAHFVLASTDMLQTHIDRRVHSFSNIDNELKTLRKTLSVIKGYKDQNDISESAYLNAKVINGLKIGKNVSFTDNVGLLGEAMEFMIESISADFETGIAETRHLLASGIHQRTPDVSGIFKPPAFLSKFEKKELPGYPVPSEHVESYVYKDELPGDVVIIAMLPKEDLSDAAAMRSACNDSSLFLGIRTGGFVPVEDVDYMDIDRLTEFLNALEALCISCMSHEQKYQRVLKSKKLLKVSLRQYFQEIIDAAMKVKKEESIVDYVEFKVVYLDKAYLAGALTLHDYAAGVLTRGMSFISANIKALSQ